MKKPLVTVLLPVYNNEQINVCIDSVLNQTYTDFELLIIDNASTDKTTDVIKSYNDKRIKLIINDKNIGPTGSLNKGINLIDTKYIARIDADDLMLPERLQKQVEFMETNPEYGIVGSWTKHIDENGNLSPINKLCITDEGIRAYMMIQSPFYHPAVMLRTSVLKDNNLNYNLDIRVAVEYELWNKILKYSKGSNLPEVLTYYRISSNSLTNKNAKLKVIEYLKVRENVCLDHNETQVLKSLEYEKKDNKSLIDCFRIFNYLNNYLKRFKSNKDYESIKSCVYSRIFETLTKENSNSNSRIIEKVLGLYRK